MGLLDSLDEYEQGVVCGSCVLSGVTSTSIFLCVRPLRAMCLDLVFHHFRVPGGTVRRQPLRFCVTC